MIENALRRAGPGLGPMVAWVHRRAGWVAFTFLLLAAAAALYTGTHLTISTDTSEMLSPDLPFQQHAKDVARAFPQLDATLLVVVDGDTPELADDAVQVLTAGLKTRPDLFPSLQDTATDPFFRENGLLFEDREDLEAMAGRLARLQPFLGVLWRDPSLAGLFDLLGQALEAERNGTLGEPLAMDPVFAAMTEVVRALTEHRFATLSWRNLMNGADPRAKGRRFLVVEPKLDYDSLAPARAAMDEVRRLAAQLRLTPDQGVLVRLTGQVALDQEELSSVEESMGVANVAALILVIGLLVIGLRDARLVGAVLATLLAGLTLSSALALMMTGRLNLISTAFAVLFIGIGVDFGIHYALRYREARERGLDDLSSLVWAAETMGSPLTLCAAGAAIGFFSFLPTDYRGLAELGQIAGASMFIALLGNLTLLPALITLWPIRTEVRRLGEKGRPAPRKETPSPAPRRITAAAVLLAGISACFIPWTRFDFDPLHLKDPDSESMSTLTDIGKDPRNGPYGITILAPDLEAAKALAVRLRTLPGVGETSSIADYLPADQEAKLEIVGTLAMMLISLFDSGHDMPVDDTRNREAVQRLSAGLAGAGGAAAEFKVALETLPDMPEVRAELERRLVGGITRRLEDLKAALGASPVGLDDLPEDIRQGQIAADGRVKVEVFPEQSLDDPGTLSRFVETVRSVAPEATGGPVIIFEASRAVLKAFRDATLVTLAGLIVMMAMVLRKARDVALVFSPLLLAALMLVPVTVLGNLPFNFANVIVLPLLFGLGIANGVQYVARERLEGDGRSVLRTSTPRAVTFSALTTMVSFGSLATSSHPGTSAMGLLLAIALTLTLLCTVLVLPALMTVWSRRGESPR